MFSKKQYHLDIQSADQTLQSIFAACNISPNTVPFDKLVLREQVRLKPYNTLIAATFTVLLLTLMTPFIFIPFHTGSGKVHNITLDQHYVIDNVLYIQVEPCHGAVNEDNTYLITASGERIGVLSYDEENHILAFPYLREECNIYIPGENGSTLHLLYTPLPN